jgi:histidinol-phosphate phosphatase family protein
LEKEKWGNCFSMSATVAALPAGVLFDRDGTLVVDVPYNADPDRVTPMPDARDALERLRELAIPIGVVTNQSGVGRGMFDLDDVDAVNRRVAEQVGGVDLVLVCPHAPEDGCACRKPEPGLVIEAARRWGADPAELVLIGDIGADVGAARAAGARGILVPTAQTLPAEISGAEEVAATLDDAVSLVLAGRGGTR